MSLLESYLNKNPKVGDIKVLMNDDQACDKFRRWSIVKKNTRDMGSQDKRSSYMPKASFRRSNKGSFFSSAENEAHELHKGSSQEEQNQGLLEVPHDSVPVHTEQVVKEVKKALLQMNQAPYLNQRIQQWMFSHTVQPTNLDIFRK